MTPDETGDALGDVEPLDHNPTDDVFDANVQAAVDVLAQAADLFAAAVMRKVARDCPANASHVLAIPDNRAGYAVSFVAAAGVPWRAELRFYDRSQAVMSVPFKGHFRRGPDRSAN
jgi:hypothetical protein